MHLPGLALAQNNLAIQADDPEETLAAAGRLDEGPELREGAPGLAAEPPAAVS